jgi:hypothetical protein
MTKPTKRQTADAIRALAEIVEDPNTPAYLRTNAARAIVSAARRSRKRVEIDDVEDEDRPQTIVILPDNGRDPHLVNEPSDCNVVHIVRDGEPLALPAPPLALPAPADAPKPRPMTAAERQRRRRERLRAEQQAAVTSAA